MKIAVLSGGTGWHVQDVIRAATDQGHAASPVDFRIVCADVQTGHDSLAGFDAVIVRTMPAGSLEQIIFRMDALQLALSRGQPILNPPRALETCVDKFLTDLRLRNAGLPVPRGFVCQTWQEAMTAFDRLGGDVVVKNDGDAVQFRVSFGPEITSDETRLLLASILALPIEAEQRAVLIAIYAGRVL